MGPLSACPGIGLLQGILGEALDPGRVPVIWAGGCRTLKVTRIRPGFPGHKHLDRVSQSSKGPRLGLP